MNWKNAAETLFGFAINRGSENISGIFNMDYLSGISNLGGDEHPNSQRFTISDYSTFDGGRNTTYVKIEYLGVGELVKVFRDVENRLKDCASLLISWRNLYLRDLQFKLETSSISKNPKSGDRATFETVASIGRAVGFYSPMRALSPATRALRRLGYARIGNGRSSILNTDKPLIATGEYRESWKNPQTALSPNAQDGEASVEMTNNHIANINMSDRWIKSKIFYGRKVPARPVLYPMQGMARKCANDLIRYLFGGDTTSELRILSGIKTAYRDYFGVKNAIKITTKVYDTYKDMSL